MEKKTVVNLPSLISDYYTLAPNPEDKTDIEAAPNCTALTKRTLSPLRRRLQNTVKPKESRDRFISAPTPTHFPSPLFAVA